MNSAFKRVQVFEIYTDYEAHIDGQLVRVTLVEGGQPYLTTRDDEPDHGDFDLVDAFEMGLTDEQARNIISGNLDYREVISREPCPCCGRMLPRSEWCINED